MTKLREEIEEILITNIVWGKKKKEVYLSKIVPEFSKLLTKIIETVPCEENDTARFDWRTGYNQAKRENKAWKKKIKEKL